MACETRYHECLVKEFTEAGYGEVHHLTVAAYMLQHASKLTQKGWLETRSLLREFLVENKSPAEVRKQNKRKVDSGMRDWKIVLDGGAPKLDEADWSKTVLDVRMENAEVYCVDVTAWARCTLEDAETIAI